MQGTATGPIRLSFESKQQVVVIPEHEDRFITTASAAALACQQAHDNQQQEADKQDWDRQFKGFLGFVHNWCGQHAEKVRACYMTVGDIGLNIIVCTHSDDYDFDFEDAVVELDLRLFNDFPRCRADVIQFPNQESLMTELSSHAQLSEALLIYGDCAGPPGSGES